MKVSLISRSKYLISYLFIFILTVITFWPVLFGEFQKAWDDQWVVLNSFTENGLELSNISSIFSSFYSGQYAPFNQLLYSSIYHFFGYEPFWFHLASLLLHLSCTTFVFLFVKTLLTDHKGFSSVSVFRITGMTTLFFAIHVLQVEPVAWISASKILVYAFFYLFALLVYLNYIKTAKYYVLLLILMVCSFFGKEQAVTLPLAMLAIDYFLGRKFTKSVLLEKLPFIIMSLFFGYITLESQAVIGQGDLSSQNVFPFYQRIVFGCYCYFEYLFKLLLPIKSMFVYLFPMKFGEPLPIRLWAYFFLMILLLAAIYSCFKKNKVLVFSFLFFTIHLLTVLHIFSMSRVALMGDRYLYVASLGLLFFIAYGLDFLVLRYRKMKHLILFIFIFSVIILSMLSHERSEIWHDSQLLKQDWKEKINLTERRVEVCSSNKY